MPSKFLLQVQLNSPYGRITLKSRSSTSHVFIQFVTAERLPGAQPPGGPPKFKLHATLIKRSENLDHRGHFKHPISQPIMHSQASHWAEILRNVIFYMGKIFLRQTNSQISINSCLNVPIVIKMCAPSSAQFSLWPNYS